MTSRGKNESPSTGSTPNSEIKVQPATELTSPDAASPPTSAPGIDRRQLLGQGGFGLAALAAGFYGLTAAAQGKSGQRLIQPNPSGPFTPAIPVPKCKIAGATSMPSHLTNSDPYDPNAFGPSAWALASGLTNNCLDPLIDSLEDFIDENKDEMADSQLVSLFYEADQNGALPTTIAEFVALFLKGLMPSFGARLPTQEGSLCIEGPEDSCIDVGCSSIPGTCWSVPALIQELGVEPCECVRHPKWWEIALAASILLILVLTPGPDEIPATMAIIGRLIVRAAPAV